jgi:hypothetical protein
MLNYFMPKPGRFGTQPVVISQRINTGTLAAGTQTHTLGGLPRKAIVSGVVVSCETYPTAATNCTVTLVKRDVSAAGNVTLSNAIDINAKTAETLQTGTLLTTLTDQQKLLDTGDLIKISLVTTGSVTVQPDDLVVTVELLLLN